MKKSLSDLLNTHDKNIDLVYDPITSNVSYSIDSDTAEKGVEILGTLNTDEFTNELKKLKISKNVKSYQ